jgi:hypothetical protein
MGTIAKAMAAIAIVSFLAACGAPAVTQPRGWYHHPHGWDHHGWDHHRRHW